MQHVCVVFGNPPPLASTNIKQCRDQLPFSGDVKAERHSGRSTSGMPFFWLTFQRAVF